MQQQKRQRRLPVEDNGSPLGLPFLDPLGVVCWVLGAAFLVGMAIVGAVICL